MPARIATNNLHSSNSINTIVTSGLVCHYDAWTKSNATQWSDLTANGFHIADSGINTMSYVNEPGIGIAYKTIGSGHYTILPNINPSNQFTTVEETIELYIYPQSNNSVWFTETSNGVNSGWHVAKIIIYNGYIYLGKWNDYIVTILLGKAILNTWNHIVYRHNSAGKLDGYLNGYPSTYSQVNNRKTPWFDMGASKVYIPCVAYDSTTYGTAADPSGYISLIRIYNRALTNDEILQNYECFRNRYYISSYVANNEPPSLIYAGNAGGNVTDYWWGYWTNYWEPWANYNLNQNIGVDFDFYFYGTNYGRGQNGSIYINGYGALAFGTNQVSNDWQPYNGKALLIGWNSNRAVIDGYYTHHHLCKTDGYSLRAFTIRVRNSRAYGYQPGSTSYWGYYYPGYYYWTDYTYWTYTVRMARTNNYQYLEVRCTESGNDQGRWQLCDGTTLTNIQSLTAGQSMVLISDSNGNGWTNYYPYYINDGIGVDPIESYNVFMRYDANVLGKLYSNGAVVTTWPNSGNINFINMNATSYGNPTLSKTGLKYYVNFSSAGQYFKIPQFNTNWIISSGGFTIAYSAYFSNPGSYSWNRIIDFGNGADVDNIGIGKYGTGTSMGLFINNSSTRLLTSYSPTTPGDGNWHIVIINVACTTNQIVVTWYDNSTSGTSYTYTGNTITEKNLYNNYIGKSNWSSDASFYGGMQEILFLKGALNSADCGNLMTYLKNKWQL